jgi:hypothetical protein
LRAETERRKDDFESLCQVRHSICHLPKQLLKVP